MNNIEENNFKNIPLADTHFHTMFPRTLDETEQTFREIMEYFGMSRITMQCIASGSGHRKEDAANNIKSLYWREKLNADGTDRAFVYGSLLNKFDGTLTADDFLSQVKLIYEMGFDGYKMLEGKPTVRKPLGHPLCDPVFDKMYAFMEETGMPLKMHLADPPAAWGPKETRTPRQLARGWWYGDGTYPGFDELHEEVYEIMRKFPKLKICLAHFFFLGHDLDKLRWFFEEYENTTVDLTPGASMFKGFTENYDKAQRFFEDYSDRIFFGSDTYNNEVKGGSTEKYEKACERITLVRSCLERKPEQKVDGGSLGEFTPLNLSEKQLRNIYIENHKKLHPSARKINKAAAIKHAEALLDGIKKGTVNYEEAGENELETNNLLQIIEYFSDKLTLS